MSEKVKLRLEPIEYSDPLYWKARALRAESLVFRQFQVMQEFVHMVDNKESGETIAKSEHYQNWRKFVSEWWSHARLD